MRADATRRRASSAKYCCAARLVQRLLQRPAEDGGRDARWLALHGRSRSLDARGSVMFHGRLKDVLKVGGENVRPGNRCPGGRSAPGGEGLCGRRRAGSAARAEVPVAFVELRPGAQATEEQILAFCRAVGEFQDSAPRLLPRRVAHECDQDRQAGAGQAADRRRQAVRFDYES